ncbi:soluble lytic murein transglycosylase [Caldicoprobacter guelmensis]|uniref:lytic transglycosylase domain-containing protein n=1 Tax=Caldicoprobacter guelmensis TaxID=1170224 RepID=UPI00195ABEAC|nr:lytic transglycosylase domain-containing protein [Caldicoprobacter guelmensis]MBM7582191.1 soluble lytic murein transglycosylase [Caldicoprobacter guelmensis]
MGRTLTFKLVLIILLALSILCVILVYGWVQRRMYPLKYEDLILRYASEYGLDPYLVCAVIWVESKFDEVATSHKGARGLMQVIPSTGRWAAEKLGIQGYDDDSLYDPAVNIRIGCWYLDRLRSQFKGDLDLALAAYNGGSSNVEKWLEDPRYSKDGKGLYDIPFKETRDFVARVWSAYGKYKQLYRIRDTY